MTGTYVSPFAEAPAFGSSDWPWPYGPASSEGDRDARPAALRSPVLLVKPPMAGLAYARTRMRAMINVAPMVGFAALAAPLLAMGAEVEVLDLDLHAADPEAALAARVRALQPAVVGFTSQTSVYGWTARLARRTREQLAPWGGVVVLGGPHASALPAEPLRDDVVDAVVVGEGEEPFQRFVAGEDPATIPGVAIRGEDGAMHLTPALEPVRELDRLPLPAWQLYDLGPYSQHVCYVYMRAAPFANVETTRGCHYRCSFCQVGGRRVRQKSCERVVREFQHAKAFGFREVHIVDDLFNVKLDRAKEVCRALIAEGVDLPWTLDNGIRVDAVDAEFADLLKRAGCWQVAFGIEAGDDAVLADIDKRIKVEQSREAVATVGRAGIETAGFFLIGLPADDEASVRKTIELARELPLDWASFRVPMPYPGTPLHERYTESGALQSTNWETYVRQKPTEQLYQHPHLSWDQLQELQRAAYLRFYLRPSYALRRLWRSLREGLTLHYLKYLVQTPW